MFPELRPIGFIGSKHPLILFCADKAFMQHQGLAIAGGHHQSLNARTNKNVTTLNSRSFGMAPDIDTWSSHPGMVANTTLVIAAANGMTRNITHM